MKQEAKFSVILPAGNYSAAQIETFEQTAQKYGLPVALPLRSDKAGNLVVATGMTLREAQMLRRQVAGCGFPADVISDVAESMRKAMKSDEPVSLDTVVVDLDDVPSINSMNAVADITSDAWSSLEMPSSLDLGLSDGANLDDGADWKGEAWLAPETSPKTMSMSALDILMGAEHEHATEKTAEKQPKSDADLHTRPFDVADIKDNLLKETDSEFDMLAVEVVDVDEKPVISDAVTMEVAVPQLEELEKAAAEHEKQLAQKQTQAADKPETVPEVAKTDTDKTDLKQTDKPTQTDAPNAHEVSKTNSSDAEPSDNLVASSQTPQRVMMVACIVIAILLLAACVDAFVTPISFLEPFLAPLF